MILIGIFSGPSARRAELISTSSHPDVVLHAVRDFIEIDGDDTPEVHAAAKRLLSAALREQASSSAQPV